MKRAHSDVDEEMADQNKKPPMGKDETGIYDWNKLREEKTLNYVLEQKGLGTLKAMADTESDREMDERDDILTEEAARKGFDEIIKTWTGEYVQLLRISQTMTVKCQQFITDLTNSSLSIKEQEDGIGTSYTSVIINSGDLTLDWEEFFERELTKPFSINCLSCLREYLYTGDGRQVLQDVLGDEHIEAVKCASHSCGMDDYDKWTAKAYEAECTEGRIAVFRNEGESSQEKQSRVVDATDEADECGVRKRLWDGTQVSREIGQVLHERKNITGNDNDRKNYTTYDRNSDIILLLCENSVFSESEAMEVLNRTPQGIEFIC